MQMLKASTDPLLHSRERKWLLSRRLDHPPFCVPKMEMQVSLYLPS